MECQLTPDKARVDQKLISEISLLKYAANDIKVFERGEDTYMSVRKTFR
jgi:hypothetical protein